MTRRDTILMAILVNAGLLLVLFATGMHAKKKEHAEPFPAPMLVEVAPEPLLHAPLAYTPHEEIEQVLNAYPTLAETTPETSVVELPAERLAPPAPALPAPPVALSSGTVTVKKGDYLEKLAKAHGTTVNELVQINRLSSTQLKIGQVLKLPPGKKGEGMPQATASEREAYYIVKAGDNPWMIASKNNVRLDELLRLNGLDENKAKSLKPGDRLRIR